MVVANEDNPVFLGGAFGTIASCYADHDVLGCLVMEPITRPTWSSGLTPPDDRQNLG
jgi:hypothetical protein